MTAEQGSGALGFLVGLAGCALTAGMHAATGGLYKGDRVVLGGRRYRVAKVLGANAVRIRETWRQPATFWNEADR